MDALWGIAAAVGHARTGVRLSGEPPLDLRISGTGYIFYLQDKSLRARFDALDKRIDETRKRLAVDY